MKVYLDDVREPNEEWIWVRRPADVIHLLLTGKVEEISLDHDLGLEDGVFKYEYGNTGYDVLVWIEKAVVRNGFIPPKISIHTDNPPARERMRNALRQIHKLVNRKD